MTSASPTKEQLLDEVRQRYAQAATAVGGGKATGCCTGDATVDESFAPRSTTAPIKKCSPRRRSRRASDAATPRRSPSCERGRRSWTSDRAVASTCCSRPAGWGDRVRLRRRHDRRDARVRSRQRGEGRRDERRVLEGDDRGRPAARCLGRRGDLELRHQPVGGQAEGARRDVPRAGSPRPHRHLRRRRRGPPDVRRSRRSGLLRRLHRRSPVEAGVPHGARRGRIRRPEVEFTHEAVPGMHGAIVRASKPVA